MIRAAIIAVGLLLPAVATAYVGFFGGAFLRFGTAIVPDVRAMNLTAADVELEANTLDTGIISYACSDEALDEVVSQNPAPGVSVQEGSLVNLVASDGTVCLSGNPGLDMPGLSMEL